MCLGIPGRVVRWLEPVGVGASAEVAFGGVSKVCHMACVPDARVDDYVLVHAGVAICRIDQVEAERILNDLRALAEMADDEILG